MHTITIRFRKNYFSDEHGKKNFKSIDSTFFKKCKKAVSNFKLIYVKKKISRDE